MIKSLLKLLIFSVIPLLIISYAIYLTGKKTDDFYKRFTSPQQNSLILGSSRAAGINPEIIDYTIAKKFPKAHLYNYAFTWAHSPFGPKYLESIKKKITEDKQGIFIVTVEPTALMIDADKHDNPKFYIENDKSVAKTSKVSVNPNLEYLWESYDYSVTRELNLKLFPPKNVMATVDVLDNGKLKTVILKPNSPKKQAEFNAGRMVEFNSRLSNLKKSPTRISYLEKTISLLKQHGKVIMVRLPISKIPYDIETKYWNDFDSVMKIIAQKEKIEYINYNLKNNNYQYTDEVHLTSQSMDDFSLNLAKDIVANQQ